MTDPLTRLVAHVTDTDFQDLPDTARAACKTFLLDSLGVAVVGSVAPWADKLVNVQGQWGTGRDARSWVFGDPLPAPAAAFANAYLIHNSEFDCIHEAAVVHPMAVTLPALAAVAEREGDIGGRDFLLALVLGVDIACHIGVAAEGKMRFFRPAMAGAFGAVAAIGKLRGFDAETLRNAIGVVYSQLCGTMQAHHEGSVLLAMQVGFNARNAVIACDMAAAGVIAPQDVLEGDYGFYALFESGHRLEETLQNLAESWRITEVAHKPFPSGRATHGVVDALLRLQEQETFVAADIDRIEARIPPLTHQLVGRMPHEAMTANQARLCVSFAAARALQNHGLGVGDFLPGALSDPHSLEFARRISAVADDNPDPNALTPVTVSVTLHDGRTFEATQSVIYGNPDRPMSREAHLAKFRSNWQSGAAALAEKNGERLVERVDDIEGVAEMRRLIDLMVR